MASTTLPASCDSCPFFMQTFVQELKRKTAQGVRAVETLTGICGAMRLSEIRATVPAYETTHRRAGDSSCYFSAPPGDGQSAKVAWLIEKRRAISSQK